MSEIFVRTGEILGIASAAWLATNDELYNVVVAVSM
jgi:hypothetical protein